jgi:hypothetical protein
MSDRATTAATDNAQRVSLDAIVIDKKLWPRDGLDWDRVSEFADLYKSEPDTLPPLALVPRRNGKYVLVDGWHRVHALVRIKAPAARAEILPADTDVYAEATRRSSISSKPLTRTEKRAAVRRLVKEHPDWHDRQIARTAGVSHTFVASQRSAFNRTTSAIGDTLKKALAPTGGYTTSAPEKDSIQKRLFYLVADEDALELTVEQLRPWFEKNPHWREAGRHVATVLYLCSQEPAPTATSTSGGDATSDQKPA